ncbi:MAG: flagellar biosynthesis protein FlhF [Bacillota bacterium]
MKVKKYVGETIQDTIFKVKADLGSEAIILDTRKYKKGGFLGFFAKKQVEVLAALEEETGPSQQTLQEINDLKGMINNLNQQWEQGSFARNLPENLAFIYDYLIEQGMDQEFIRSFIRRLQSKTEDYREILHITREQLKHVIGKVEPIDPDSAKVIAFTGPTGVGKTTTIAKIAARFALQENHRVGLVTADTYRIAAVQQLQTYSDIVNLPLEVVYDEQELQGVVRDKFQDFDLIFIDTAGSSWQDELQLGKLRQIANNSLIDEVHLLLSLNTKTGDLFSILENFSSVDPDRLILTKLDETTTYGDIINLSRYSQLPYSYITFGQDVPDDIAVAHPETMVDYIFSGLGDINGN